MKIGITHKILSANLLLPKIYIEPYPSLIPRKRVLIQLKNEEKNSFDNHKKTIANTMGIVTMLKANVIVVIPDA